MYAQIGAGYAGLKLGAALDVGLSRNAAGIAEINTGAAGTRANLLVGALSMLAPTTQAGTTYTVAATDSSVVINSSANFTLTLPAASGANSGRWLLIKQIAAFTVISASNNVAPQGATAAGNAILSGAGKWALLQSDGTNWVIMMSN
jgi:hypothetical protein